MFRGLLNLVIHIAAKINRATTQTIKLLYSPLRWRNIYAISSLFILFWLANSFWRLAEFWKWLGYISTAAVIAGVVGEMISDFGAFPDNKVGRDRKDAIGKLSSIVLVLGLALELFATARTNQLSDEVIADLESQASRTLTALGPAMARASEANATAESAKASVKLYDKQIAGDQARIKTAEATVAASKASVSEAVAEVATAEARIAEAQRGAEEAKKESAALHLEEMKLRAIIQPRTLGPDQKREIANGLALFAGRHIAVISYGQDLEAVVLCREITDIVETAKLINTRGCGGFVSVGFDIGVHVRGPNDQQDLVMSIAALLKSKGGLMVSTNVPESHGVTLMQPPDPKKLVVVNVGVKPMPEQ